MTAHVNDRKDSGTLFWERKFQKVWGKLEISNFMIPCSQRKDTSKGMRSSKEHESDKRVTHDSSEDK